MFAFNINLVSNSLNDQGKKELEKTMEYLKPLLEKLEKSKATVMEEVQNNLRIMAWMAWGVGYIFEDKKPHEMLDYMQNPDLEELKSLVHIVPSQTYESLFRDFFLENLAIVRDYNRSFSVFQNEELQEAAKEATDSLFYYLCSMKFGLEDCLNSEKSSDLSNYTQIWIYPYTKGLGVQNYFYTNPLTLMFKNEEDVAGKKDDGEFDKGKSYYFFLGDPDKRDDELVISEETLRMHVLLHLFDCLFNLEIPPDRRFRMLRPFGLLDPDSKKVIDAIKTMVADYEALRDSLPGKSLDNIEKLKNVAKAVKFKWEELESKYKKKKDEYEKMLAAYKEWLIQNEELKVEADVYKFWYDEFKTIIGISEDESLK